MTNLHRRAAAAAVQQQENQLKPASAKLRWALCDLAELIGPRRRSDLT